MSFVDLDNTTQVKTDVPDMGVVIGSRAAGRGDKKARYIAISIGPGLAKNLGFHLPQQKVTVRAGTGDDAGKLAITVNHLSGKFVAKKQKSGNYLLTLGEKAILGHFTNDFEKTVIQAPRFIPTVGQTGPMVIIKVPQ